MKSIYVATVQLAFEAGDDEESLEAVLAMLTKNLVQSRTLIDWQFIQDEIGNFQYPIYAGKYANAEIGSQFMESLASCLSDGRIYRIPKVTSSKLELLQMGKHRFIQHFLLNSYHSSFGNLKGFNKWSKKDESAYNAAFNFAVDLYDNIVNNAGKNFDTSLLAAGSIGVVCVKDAYYIQVVFPENKHEYFTRTSARVAYALAQKEGVTIEDIDALPSGVYLSK